MLRVQRIFRNGARALPAARPSALTAAVGAGDDSRPPPAGHDPAALDSWPTTRQRVGLLAAGRGVAQGHWPSIRSWQPGKNGLSITPDSSI